MNQICGLLIALSVLQGIRSDFEDCELVNNQGDLSSKAKNGKLKTNLGEWDLTFDGESNIVTQASFKSNSSTKYDGFICLEDSERSDKSKAIGTAPCKQYLYYAHQALKNTELESLKCYREFDPSKKKTIAILILNSKENRSAEEYLRDIDSYSEVNRYFIAVLEYIARTATSFLPILDIKSPHRWTQHHNLIVEYTGPNEIAVRFRFIDTGKGQSTRRVLASYIEQAFYYIKVFLHKDTSCKKIVQEEYQYDKALEALMQLDPTFPKNFRRIFAVIERTCSDSPLVITPAKLKHKILMKMVVMGYCLESIAYDMDTLYALIDIVASIFMDDQLFDRADEQARFENYFFHNSLKREIQKSETYKKMRDQNETGKLIEKEVADEPAFSSVIDKEIQATQQLGNRERMLWLDMNHRQPDYKVYEQSMSLDYEKDEYDNVSF